MFYEPLHSVVSNEFRVWNTKNIAFPIHIHRSYECLLVRRGTVKVTVDGREFVPKENEGVLIFPHQRHQYDAIGDSETLLCIFSAEYIPAFHSAVTGKRAVTNLFSYTHMRGACWQDNDFLKKSFLYGITGSFFDQVKMMENRGNTGADNLLDAMLDDVEENYLSECSLEWLANHLGYDYTYLSKFFRKRTGMTYTAYLNTCRVSRACSLLRSGSASVSEVAMQSGFSSIRSFNYEFKRTVGVTPAQYRKNESKTP